MNLKSNGINGKVIPATTFGFLKTLVDFLIKPGGPFDRRFRRIIRREISSATEREEKAAIRQGIKILRITPYATFRGESTTIQASNYNEGNPIYSQDFELKFVYYLIN